MADVVLNLEEDSESTKSSSILRIVRTIFHCVCFGVWCLVISWGGYIWINMTQKNLEHPVLNDLKMLTPCFLTNWNYNRETLLAFFTLCLPRKGLGAMVFQTIFLGLSLGHDILEWADKKNSVLGTKTRYWKNVLFHSVVVPYTLFVTTMFWCIYAVDRELVFPKIYDEVVPWWFNHCVHTNITIMVVIESLLEARRRPTDVKMETILHIIVAVSYAIVYYAIYYFSRRWLYQVFGIMTWWQICLYQLLIWSSCYFFYRMQFPISRLVHGAEEVEYKTASVKEENGVESSNGHTNGISKNGKVLNDLETPQFSDREWSLKYRSAKNQIENSKL